MPVYHVKDAETGMELDLRGDRPPTEAELVQIFANKKAQADVPRRAMVDSLIGRRRLSGGEDDTPNALESLNDSLQGAAHPQTLGDISQLLLPAGVETAIGAARGYYNAAKEALPNSATLRGMPREMLSVLYNKAFPPTGAHLDTNIPVRAGSLTQAQIGERVTQGRPGGIPKWGAKVPESAPEAPPVPARTKPAPVPQTDISDAAVPPAATNQAAAAATAQDVTPATADTAPAATPPGETSVRGRANAPKTTRRGARAASAQSTPSPEEEALAKKLFDKDMTVDEVREHILRDRELRDKLNVISPEDAIKESDRIAAEAAKRRAARAARRAKRSPRDYSEYDED